MTLDGWLARVHSACIARDATAFVIREEQHSYAELGAAIAAVRRVLETEHAQERLIGIVAHDDLETYAAVFAVWFAGKTMVPLAPGEPAQRTARIVEQAGLRVVASSRGSEGAPEGLRVLTTRGLTPLSLETPCPRLASDVAYLLFTSGSTGVPKGVPISHGALQAFLHAFGELGYAVGPDDRFLQMFDLTFDLSLMSYCVPLALGATVYTVPPESIRYTSVARILEDHEITFALMVPSILGHLRGFLAELTLPALRWSLFCGEALYADLAAEWQASAPNARVDNVYGPTEATIFCLAYRCARVGDAKTSKGVVSIGRPIGGVGTLLVDADLQPVEPGGKGELCLSGPQLTAGYWNDPDKSARAFFVYDDQVHYRTGDLCTRDEDGDFMYCGRLDHQVKVQGFRVELGEVEHHVRVVTGLAHVAAVVRPGPDGNLRIHVFLERYGEPLPPLLARLREVLPSHMVPSYAHELEALPLTVNAKIDRRALESRMLHDEVVP